MFMLLQQIINDTKIQVLNIDREKTVSDISLHFEKENLCSVTEIKQRLRKLKQIDPTYEKICTACCIVGVVQFSDENIIIYTLSPRRKKLEKSTDLLFTQSKTSSLYKLVQV